MSPVDVDPRLERARDAAKARRWPEAHESLSALDAELSLEPDDLESLAKSAWWTGHSTASIEARERAYAGYLEGGDRERAAFLALTLRREQAAKLNSSAAKGWLRTAERLLDGVPDSPTHGFLELAHGELSNDGPEVAIERFRHAAEIAGRFRSRDLAIWAAMREGMALVADGRLEAGWDLMEEACAAAVGGELGAYTTGAVFCNVISVCCELAEFRRASEWSEAAARWCDRQSIAGFPGICRVRRAEVLRLVGSLSEAETEVSRACVELEEFSPAFAGEAFAELGEVRLRVGDLSGAEDAFRQAHGFGVDPQPGLARLQLARGNPQAAATSIARRLDDATEAPLTRAKLLPLQAEIAWSRQDAATAEEAAEEMAAIAERFPTGAIQAAAAWTAGIAATAAGDLATSIRTLRRAAKLWREVGAPHEAAMTGLMLAEVYTRDGDTDSARMEAESAQAALEALGAGPDAKRAVRMLSDLTPETNRRRVLRTFLFTDIVGSTSLLDAIGDDAWQDVRRWHDDTLRACFPRHDGDEVDHAGDGFFVSFPDAASAVACAIEIQQRLVAHRREHGFAPSVRIGLHAAEATEDGEGFAGRGVHAAARIGALAGGGEILASHDTVARAGRRDRVDGPRGRPQGILRGRSDRLHRLVRRLKREEWDSNPRAPSPRPTVFKTVAFVRSAILPGSSVVAARIMELRAAAPRRRSDVGSDRTHRHHRVEMPGLCSLGRIGR